jgi:hypothetical protein
VGEAMAKRFGIILRQICCHTEENILGLMRREDEAVKSRGPTIEGST